MDKRKLLSMAFAMTVLAGGSIAVSACSSAKSEKQDSASVQDAKDMAMDQKGKMGGPQLGEKPRGGMVVDKSGDATLQKMIADVLPQFRQLEYKDTETGKTMTYNLYSPSSREAGKKYPLVLFIADASTPGDDPTLPLKQGYGGLIWATEEWQKDHPCFVLVPQFSGVAVNDAHDHTDEVDVVIRMLKDICSREAVDTDRLYTTGQSMGGMISMYYNVEYPDVFAASVFVDSHWNLATFPELARHKFVWFIAGDSGKAYAQLEAMENAAKGDGVKYAFSEWSAKLPEADQDRLANEMFAKDAPVNIIEFTPKSVLPADGKGSEHMMSFDYAYKVCAVREWLFRQSK